MTSQNVEVKLELGHRATLRDNPTEEGFTHNWTLFVRGPDGCNIQHFVEKVVFYLHESFPKPKRVLKEPPYHVSESGYAGFNLAIEVHFRNKEDPKKVHFDYDLYLHLEGPPIQNSRLEKLTFQNPNSEFKKKLLKGGGVAVSGGSQSGSTCSSSNPVQTETEPAVRPKSIKGSNEVPKKAPKTKLPHITKEPPPKVPEPVRQPFTDIFGTPIKAKPSPDTPAVVVVSHKSKENNKEKAPSSNSSSKSTSASTSSTTSLSSSSNNVKPAPKESHKAPPATKDKVPKPISKESEKKEVKSNSESKTNSLKRSSSPPPPPLPPSQGHKGEDESVKKRKRSTSTSSANSNVTDKTSSKDKKAKTKSKEHVKENKAVPPQPPVPVKKESHKPIKAAQKAPRKEPREKSPVPPPPPPSEEPDTLPGRPRLESNSSEGTCRSQEDKEVKVEEAESRSSNGSASSPASSLSLSSLPPSSTHRPLAALMAEMDQDLVSPLSSEQPSPAHTVASPEPLTSVVSPPGSPEMPHTPVRVVEEKPPKKGKDKRQSEKPSQPSKKTKEEPVESCPPQSKGERKPQPIDEAYLRELMQLQERIMALRDKQHLQRIVDVIEETGLYQITSSTIDFDLCALDRSTVQKLQNCMTVT